MTGMEMWRWSWSLLIVQELTVQVLPIEQILKRRRGVVVDWNMRTGRKESGRYLFSAENIEYVGKFIQEGIDGDGNTSNEQGAI